MDRPIDSLPTTHHVGGISIGGRSNVVHIGDIHINQQQPGILEKIRYNELVNRLPALDFKAKQENVHDQCSSGTGQWFLESAQYQSWLARGAQTLWCPGIPGAGKTFMASIVIESLKSVCTVQREFALAYVFFDYGNRQQYSRAAIYGNLLLQIIQKQPHLSQALFTKYEEIRDRATLNDQHYLTLLEVVATHYEKIFIVVDALDECSETERTRTIKGICSIGSHIRILVTSRPIGVIAQLFDGHPTLDILAADHDMAVYVRDELQADDNLRELVADDPELEEAIVSGLIQKAQNMFLMVRLHMKQLSVEWSKADILHAIDILPQELELTYKQALSRICETVPTKGLSVLMWLVTTLRPLSLREMQHALAVKTGQSKFEQNNLVENVHRLASSCAGMVVTDQKNNTIRLVHYTAQEFLEKHLDGYLRRHFGSSYTQPHSVVARTCLTYLNFKDFEPVLEEDCHLYMERQKMLDMLPFSAYAAYAWGWHLARLEQPEADLEDLAVRLLSPEARASDELLLHPSPAEVADADPHRWFIDRSAPKGLHIAAHFGLRSVFEKLRTCGSEFKCRDNKGNTPLHYAAWTGQTKILQTYVDNGQDLMVFNNDCRQRVPLVCAAYNGQDGFIASLIASGVDVNFDPQGSDSTLPALHEAIRNQYSTVTTLLELGADIELRSTRHSLTPLECACESVRPSLITLLLERGATLGELNSRQILLRLIRRNDWVTPREYADAMAILCHHGVDVNQVLEHGYRALDFELTFGREKAIEVLISAKAVPGQTWYSNQPAIRRWSIKPWFSQLLSRCEHAGPRTMSSELQTVFITRQQECEGVFIMDNECYGCTWGFFYPHPRPFLAAGGPDSFDSGPFGRARPYISMVVPDNFVRVTKIVITTESHDQGYTSDAQYANGTYDLSYTWFDLAFMYHKHPEHPIWQDRVQFNVNGRWEWKTHVNVWEVGEFDDFRSYRADAIWQLRPGDNVLLYARAFFPAWQNHVKRAELRLEGLEMKPEADGA